MPHDPFCLPAPPNAPLRRAALAVARPLLSGVLGLRTFRRLYRQTRGASSDPFEIRALEALGIDPTCAPEELSAIPSRGPVLVAANHPHGALDGLVLASLVRQVRPDVRVVTNYLLSRIPELSDLCFFVDPFDGAAAAARSRAGLRAAHLWLREGGALIMFPAGEVAHERRADGSYADSPWHSTVGRLALATGARVVPAFIAGSNSRMFYAAGRVHASLRTVLLARELLNKRGHAARVMLGPSVGHEALACHVGDARAATQTIRNAVDRLSERAPTAVAVTRLGKDTASDVARLPPECCLVESGGFRVYCAEASQIPSALPEIGRLRELTFRAVGEGTGRDLDLDRFDDRYLHLFSWDLRQRQIVGAYRIGRTDQIVATEGVNGLYTRTLFRYDDRLVARLSPALELGRSFVRAEYQKNHGALLLLWKGIARYVALHPQYRVLFGPVSISARYSDVSQQLLMAFLQQNHRHEELADLATAINPAAPRAPASLAGIPRSVDEADRLVAQAENDRKGVPILLRQYLRLNARLIGFNVDPEFGDALDALMMVDLTAVDPGILVRYFGRSEAAAFLARHATKAA
jgi:putative hemolysin